MKKVLIFSVIGMFCICASAAFAEDISVTIKKDIARIAKLTSGPAPTDADKAAAEKLIQKIQDLGMNVPPALEEVLGSKKSSDAEKKVAVHLVGRVYQTNDASEYERKGTQMIRIWKTALADPSADVRKYALLAVMGTWTSETYSTIRDVFRGDTDAGVRILALDRIAGYYVTSDADAVLAEALADPDPLIRSRAQELKVYRDDLKAKQAAMAATAQNRSANESPRPSRGHGKG